MLLLLLQAWQESGPRAQDGPEQLVAQEKRPPSSRGRHRTAFPKGGQHRQQLPRAGFGWLITITELGRKSAPMEIPE